MAPPKVESLNYARQAEPSAVETEEIAENISIGKDIKSSTWDVEADKKGEGEISKPSKEDPPGRITSKVVLCIFASCIGNAFVYGWHIAVINQPLELITDFFNQTYINRGSEYDDSTITLLISIMASIWVLFGFIGALFAGKVADYFGRKRGMQWVSFIMDVSAACGFGAQYLESPELLILCRLIAGIHAGLCMALNTLYLSEISPTKYRGAIGTMFQMNIVIGILAAQIFGIPELFGTKDLWPILFVMSAIPGTISYFVLQACPESPSFLLVKAGNEEEAKKALIALRNTDQVENELAEIKAEAEAVKSVTNYSIKQLLSDKSLRLNVIIACFIMLAQQFSGINAVFTYSTLMFESVNIQKSTLPYIVVLTGLVNCLITIPAIPMMDKLGRRTLLLYPTILACFSFIVITIMLMMSEGTDDKESKTTYGVISIVMFMTYIIGFATGLGPVPWVLVCEIFKQEPRAAANSLALCCNWGANFILTVTFPFLNKALEAKVNLPFIVCLVVSILFFLKYVPETKGKTIEEIQKMISGGKSEEKNEEKNEEKKE